MFSKLIHTVDHVEVIYGRADALDGASATRGP